MESQKSQGRLTRTNSSLLRSSPTIRSSIHSLSSVSEIDADRETSDLEEQKLHDKPAPPSVRRSSSRLAPPIALIVLCVYTFVSFFNRNNIPTSESVLLALIFVAVLLCIVAKNKALANRGVHVCKQFCDECAQRFRFRPSFLSSKGHSYSVEWYIGEVNSYEIDRKKVKKNDHKIVREGVEFYGNGDFYEGEFHKGRAGGSGVYNYFGSGRYEGDWIDGKYDGFGIESWAKGSRYKGQYRQGLRHGCGIFKFYTGDTYAGEWFNGQSHGIGVQTCADGSCYSGEFKFGVKHGLGCYHFRNGDRYAGEYFEDKMHGFGVYHFANGHYYQGSWHEGRKQGYGMYTFRSGDTRCGEWDRGDLKVPHPALSERVVRAVQSASRTSENAIHLRRVDEQVNKAVVAANKAATAARVAAIKAVQNRIDGKFCDIGNI